MGGAPPLLLSLFLKSILCCSSTKNELLTAGQCPSSDEAKVEWNHLISKIIKASYSEFHLTSLDESCVWGSSENTSKFYIFCLHGLIPGGLVNCRFAAGNQSNWSKTPDYGHLRRQGAVDSREEKVRTG